MSTLSEPKYPCPNCGCYPRVKAGLVKRFKADEVVRQDQRWQCKTCRIKYTEDTPEKTERLKRTGEAAWEYAFNWKSIREVAESLKISKSQAWRLIHQVVVASASPHLKNERVNASSYEIDVLKQTARAFGIAIPMELPIRLSIQLRINRLWLSGYPAGQFVIEYQKWVKQYGHLWRAGIRPRIYVSPHKKPNQFRTFYITPYQLET